MDVKQISVFMENKPGKLAELAKVLRQNGINMRALSLAEAPEFGVVRIIVDDPYKLSEALKEEEYVFTVTKVLAAEVKDQAGSLVKILDILAENNINLEYTYTFLSRKKDAAYMIFRVNDNEAAVRALSAGGIKLLCQDDFDDLLK
jgi:ACT domain-containing protein